MCEKGGTCKNKGKQYTRDIKDIYFEALPSSTIYEVLNYLKRKNKFNEDISISYGLNSQEILNLLDVSATDKSAADNLIVENVLNQ